MSDQTTPSESSDAAWLLKYFGSFRDLLNEDYEHWKQTGNHSKPHEISHRMGFIKILVRRIDFDAVARMEYESGPRAWGWQPALMEVNRLIGVLEHEERFRAKRAAEPPNLAADQLHPRVWDGAVHFWGDDGYDAAVQTAAFAVAELTRRKIGCHDLDGEELYAELFSTDAPQPGAPRLRFPDFDYSEEPQRWTAAHEGARRFGMGCAHNIGDPDAHLFSTTEQEALEKLAALSVLARWVDDCKVVNAPHKK